MDFNLTPAEEAFREEVRAFIRAHAPKNRGDMAAVGEWHKQVRAKRWVGLSLSGHWVISTRGPLACGAGSMSSRPMRPISALSTDGVENTSLGSDNYIASLVRTS